MRQRVTASAEKSLFWNKDLAVGQVSIAWMLKVFSNKTETLLKDDTMVIYTVQVVALNKGSSYADFSFLTST